MDMRQYVDACLDRAVSTTRDIAAGSGVRESWLGMYRRGKIPNPGYDKIKALADYFLRTGEMPVLVEQGEAPREQPHA